MSLPALTTKASRTPTISSCACNPITSTPKTPTRMTRFRGSHRFVTALHSTTSVPTWSASIEGQRVNRQYRTAPFETETPGYTFLNASLSRRFRVGPTYVDLYLRATNLTNEEARDHLSFLKEVLPLEGRSVVVGLRTTF